METILNWNEHGNYSDGISGKILDGNSGEISEEIAKEIPEESYMNLGKNL